MGLLDNLFRTSKRSGEKGSNDSASQPSSEPGGNTLDQAATAQPAVSGYVLAHDGSRGDEAPNDSVAQVPADAVELALGDVLDHIPTRFLRPGLHDAERRFHVRIGDIAEADSPRPTVALARLDAQCPGVLAGDPDELRAARVPLPAGVIPRAHSLHRTYAPPAPPSPVAPPSTTAEATPSSPASNPSSRAAVPRFEAGSTGTASAAAPPLSRARDEKLDLSLASVMKRCPRDIIVRDLPALNESARLSVPLAAIDSQLPNGKVELTSLQFVGALPVEYMEFFHPIDGVKVPLPLQEILEKLPRTRFDGERATDTRTEASAQPADPPGEMVSAKPKESASLPDPQTAGTSTAMPPRPSVLQPEPAPKPSAAARARSKIIPTSGTVALPVAKKPCDGGNPAAAIAERFAALPGVRGCAVLAQGNHAVAGEFDRGMDLLAVRTLAEQLDATLRAGDVPVAPGVREVLLPGETASFACYIGREVAVITLLRTHTPLPMVRTELANAAAAVLSSAPNASPT